MKLHRYVDHQRLHIVTKDVISLSISVLLLFRHYISHKITFGAPSSGGVLRSACGAFIYIHRSRLGFYTSFTRHSYQSYGPSFMPEFCFCSICLEQIDRFLLNLKYAFILIRSSLG